LQDARIAKQRCQTVNGAREPRCIALVWPVGWFPYDRRASYQRTGWHGTLLEDKADKAGTLYRRNRVYDPATARFTQEDPIGLAGGLTLDRVHRPRSVPRSPFPGPRLSFPCVRITYIGHATLLFELGGHRLLTDPNFDEHLGRFLKRVSRPGIALDALPALDAVLLTHAHADHLSFASLDALPQDVPVFAPPDVQRWLAGKGYRQVVPLAPGASAEVGGLRVHAAAATHVGARYAVDRWRADANMYLVDAADAGTFFFAGDTALTPESHHLAERLLHRIDRTLDVALLPIGYAPWYKPGFRKGHLTSADALELFVRLRARYLIPYHWGTFNHVTSSALDAITCLRAALPAFARHADVHIIEPSETFELPTSA